jgi:hypothetical protein
MKMPSYLENQAEAYGCLEELEDYPKKARACPRVGASLLKQ